MEQTETAHLNSPNSELDLPLHKIFVDLSLENDLKGEELEWFRSRIASEKKDDKSADEQTVSGSKRVEIVKGSYLTTPVKTTENKLFLRFTETNTIWLFSLDTSFSENNVKDAERVRWENETYLKKKTKKELIRKRCMADSQTPRHIEKSVGTLTTEINKADAVILASEWDLYDTYNILDKCELAPSKKYHKFIGLTDRESLTALNENIQKPSSAEKTTKLFESSDFRYASLVVERLLASNCFQFQQTIFKKKYKLRYDETPSSFSYKMELLWDFQKDFKHPLMVTDMDWNPLNKDLLAVGYGNLRFEENSSGLICVWSPKNPRQPEREFHLDESVTSLHYSRTRPNILAVGTRIGNVYVINISTHTTNIRNIGSPSPRPGPIWKVEWFLHEELISETEELLAVGESGVLMRFSMSEDKEAADVLKLNYVTSTKRIPEKRLLKKLQYSTFQDTVFHKKTFSGLSFSLMFDRNFCYISTKEGVIIKCNMRNPSMNDGIFLGHDGPVYTIQHSPATDLIFLTCGADWNIKIWMEGIHEPLITLQNKTPVLCAKWSVTIPTVIASVGYSEVYLWDIARNVLSPMSVKKDFGKSFSTLLFSFNGKNLVLGDEDGLAHVIHLSELPRIPFLQKEALVAAIKSSLIKSESKLYDLFKRVVEANREKLKTEIVV